MAVMRLHRNTLCNALQRTATHPATRYNKPGVNADKSYLACLITGIFARMSLQGLMNDLSVNGHKETETETETEVETETETETL